VSDTYRVTIILTDGTRIAINYDSRETADEFLGRLHPTGTTTWLVVDNRGVKHVIPEAYIYRCERSKLTPLLAPDIAVGTRVQVTLGGATAVVTSRNGVTASVRYEESGRHRHFLPVHKLWRAK
jgi:hypothetical protein